MLWLMRGDLEQGWGEYEWRWKIAGNPRRYASQPLWDGSPLAGRTILVYWEQGLGDTMQFVRYLPLLRQLGAGTILECPPGLIPLLSSAAGVDHLIAQGSTPPSFDVQAPLLDLPAIIQTSLNHIPAAIPYLDADPRLVEYWPEELQKDEGGRMKDERIAHSDSSFILPPSSFRVGIAWQGTPTHRLDRQRSISLAEFGPLAEVDGVRLISLQKGAGAGQTETIKDEGGRMKVSSFVLDETVGAFMDSAAIIKSLDLVVSSDTAVPHLAGALGVPVWVALSTVPDWRWLLEREDSPWYPTMRLFRQTRAGQWADVFERMARELHKILPRINADKGRDESGN
jgi:hypothetical protein